MMKQMVVLAAFVVGMPAAQAEVCDWKMHARDADHGTIERAVQRLATRFETNDFDQNDEGIQLARTLSERARSAQSLPLGTISGEWRVRSIQGGNNTAYAYPSFHAWIAQHALCGQFFEKYTGSQRRSGHLYPIPGEQAMAFVGAKTVNDDPTLSYALHGAAESNTVGKLLRLSDDELLLILDVDSDKPLDGYELYYLHR